MSRHLGFVPFKNGTIQRALKTIQRRHIGIIPAFRNELLIGLGLGQWIAYHGDEIGLVDRVAATRSGTGRTTAPRMEWLACFNPPAKFGEGKRGALHGTGRDPQYSANRHGIQGQIHGQADFRAAFAFSVMTKAAVKRKDSGKPAAFQYQRDFARLKDFLPMS